tara:strand:+ start:475 stop:648 length:174 start_codon:yes stop_codon:yes gene_type:complete
MIPKRKKLLKKDHLDRVELIIAQFLSTPRMKQLIIVVIKKSLKDVIYISGGGKKMAL